MNVSAGASAQGAEKIFMDTPDNPVKAFVPISQNCGKEMKYTLRAAVPEVFYPSPEKVQLLLGGLRIALAQDCPMANRIVMRGYVGDILYFAAVATAEDGWEMTWLAAPPSR